MRADKLGTFHTNCRFAAFLTLVSISFTFAILVGILVVANGFANFIVPFILRGTVLGAWGLGIIIVIVGIAAGSVKKRTNVKMVSSLIIILCMVQIIMVLVAGIDVSKTFFSPVTFAGKIGEFMTHAVFKSKHLPASLRGGQSELIASMIGKVGASIITVELIGILPFPYNVILFFVYYRFVTVMVVCILPVLFASLACYKAYETRLKPKNLNPPSSSDDSIREFIESSDSESERNPLRGIGFVRPRTIRQNTAEQTSERFPA